jgi:hypothetical protein
LILPFGEKAALDYEVTLIAGKFCLLLEEIIRHTSRASPRLHIDFVDLIIAAMHGNHKPVTSHIKRTTGLFDEPLIINHAIDHIIGPAHSQAHVTTNAPWAEDFSHLIGFNNGITQMT